jgi:hypothetical protein
MVPISCSYEKQLCTLPLDFHALCWPSTLYSLVSRSLSLALMLALSCSLFPVLAYSLNLWAAHPPCARGSPIMGTGGRKKRKILEREGEASLCWRRLCLGKGQRAEMPVWPCASTSPAKNVPHAGWKWIMKFLIIHLFAAEYRGAWAALGVRCRWAALHEQWCF